MHGFDVFRMVENTPTKGLVHCNKKDPMKTCTKKSNLGPLMYEMPQGRRRSFKSYDASVGVRNPKQQLFTRRPLGGQSVFVLNDKVFWKLHRITRTNSFSDLV